MTKKELGYDEEGDFDLTLEMKEQEEREIENVKIFTGTLKSISDREFTDNFVTLINFKQAIKDTRNKALDEVEKMIDKHLKGYGRNDCDCDYCIGMRNLKQNIKEMRGK